MASPRLTAVDCGTGHAACGVFALGSGGELILNSFAWQEHDPDPNADARWIETTGRVVTEIASKTKAGGSCSVTLPGHHTLTKFIRTPSSSSDKRQKIIEFEAQQAIPHPLDEVVWGHLELHDDGIDTEVVLAAVKRELVDKLHATMTGSGLEAERFTPAGLALWRAFRFCYPEVNESVILVSIGARSTQLLFLEKGHVFHRTLGFGGNTVTQQIAEELRLEFAPAETLKKQVLAGKDSLPEHSPARVAVRQAAHGFAVRLATEIGRSSVIYRRNSDAAMPVALYYTGGGSLIGELPQILADKLKLPVERFDPLRKLELGPKIADADVKSNEHILAELVGLASSLLAKGPHLINLLPLSVGQALAFRRKMPWFIAACVCFAGMPLPVIWHYQHVYELAQSQVQALETRLIPLQVNARRNLANQGRIESATKQIEVIRSVMKVKGAWTEFLADLQGRLSQVDDVWLDRLQMVPFPDEAALSEEGAAAQNGSGESPSGTAQTEAQGAQAPAAGEAVAGATPSAPGSEVAAAQTPPPAEAAAAPQPVQRHRLILAGRFIDRQNPLTKVSPASYARVKALLAGFAGSPFVAEVRDEKFDATQPGLLHFECTLVIKNRHPLL